MGAQHPIMDSHHLRAHEYYVIIFLIQQALIAVRAKH